MSIRVTEYRGVIVVVKEVYNGEVYIFNDKEYLRFYEVTHAIDLYLGV